MSMISCLVRTPDDVLEKLRAQPPLIRRYLGMDGGGAPPVRKPGFWASLFGAKPQVPPPQSSASEPAPAFPARREADEFCVEKAWHGLHFLLTGTEWEGEMPLCFLVTGGETIGDEDLGYGPGRAFSSAQVKELAVALAGVDEAELRRRFDPEKMMAADIYPTIWDRPPEEDDTLTWLLGTFTEMRVFVTKAAADGQGLIVYLC